MSGHHRNRNPVQPRATVAAVGALIVVAGAGARPVHADGAFPDAQSVLLARDRPHQIILAANFGLVFTEDDGATWAYSCETPATAGGYRYAVGPPAAASSAGVSGDRIFAISNPEPGAPVSADDACTWTQPGGALLATGGAPPNYATDVFPDPSDPARVFLLAAPDDPADPDAPGGVYRSMDGGRTYAGPLYVPATGASSTRPALTGIEVSASSPGTVYVTWYERTGTHPHLARSMDGGDTWSDQSIEAELGAAKPYLAAIDPSDPQVVFLRTISSDGASEQKETLAATRDGGSSWSTPITEPGGTLKGFVRRQDGAWFALAQPRSADATVAPSALYQSADGGRTFTRASLAFHGKGLGQRDGTLFLATDNVVDLVALVSSTDAVTWKPRLRFEDISSIRGCVYASCRDACDLLLGNAPIFSPDVCSRSSSGQGGKGGAAAPGGSGGSSGGCACSLADRTGDGRAPRSPSAERAGGLAAAGFLVLASLLVRVSRRSRTRPHRRPGCPTRT